jgi:hypothetical protein
MSDQTCIEFEPRDVAECIGLWHSIAGSRPAHVLHLENGSGIVAMFPPVASWEDLGPARDFDLVFPAGTPAVAALKLAPPWRALPLSDFLCHIFDASRTASPEETIRTTIDCMEALGGGLPPRLRARTFVPSGLRP